MRQTKLKFYMFSRLIYFMKLVCLKTSLFKRKILINTELKCFFTLFPVQIYGINY